MVFEGYIWCFRVDNNTKLVLMLDVFQDQEEKFIKVKIIYCVLLVYIIMYIIYIYREISMFCHHLFPRNMTELRI